MMKMQDEVRSMNNDRARELVEKPWVPQIGERVRVSSAKEWASDWVDPAGNPLELFVAGVRAIPNGGVDVTTSETWPLKAQKLFGSSSLTDGFIVGREGEQDDLAPIEQSLTSAAECSHEQQSGDGVWYAVCLDCGKDLLKESRSAAVDEALTPPEGDTVSDEVVERQQ